MPQYFREEWVWLDSRRGKITSSRAPMLFGAGYEGAGPMQLWAELSGHLSPEEGRTDALKRILEMGQQAEPVIAKWGDRWIQENVKGHRFAHAKTRLAFAPPGTELQGAPDGLVLTHAKLSEWVRDIRNGKKPPAYAVGEIKNVLSPGIPKAWKDEPTEYAIVQTHFNMLVIELDTGVRIDRAVIVASFGNGANFQVYEVERNDKLVSAIEERSRMMLSLVKSGQAPPDSWIDESASTAASIKAMYGKVESETVELEVDSELWGRFLQGKAMKKEGGDAERHAKSLIMKRVGNAERAVVRVEGEDAAKIVRYPVKGSDACDFCGKKARKGRVDSKITIIDKGE